MKLEIEKIKFEITLEELRKVWKTIWKNIKNGLFIFLLLKELLTLSPVKVESFPVKKILKEIINLSG